MKKLLTLSLLLFSLEGYGAGTVVKTIGYNLFNNGNDTVDGVAYTTNFCLNDGDKITLAAYAANQWKVVNYPAVSTI